MSKPQEQNSLPLRIVEELTKKLDITDSMHDDAVSKYKAVAKYLGESNNPLLQNAEIYPQGSINLRTVVKPIGKNEFDIDLVILLPNVTKEHDSNDIHKIIGERLKEEGSRYKDICTSKKRCWTINYKSEFHLDITPAIANPFVEAEEFHYTDTAELVPDKERSEWKDSNPRGFAKWFAEIAETMPIFVIRKVKGLDVRASNESIMESYTVEDIPDNNEYKGLLRRTVQLLKKHRDTYFDERYKKLKDHKPISIVITTLVAKSYRKIVENAIVYTCPFEMMKDIVRNMDSFIKQGDLFKIVNPTNENENFAEKWNDDVKKAEAFAIWQMEAFNVLEELQKQNGMNKIGPLLENHFGKDNANHVIKAIASQVEDDRSNGILTAAIITSTVATSTSKANTFFGK